MKNLISLGNLVSSDILLGIKEVTHVTVHVQEKAEDALNSSLVGYTIYIFHC